MKRLGFGVLKGSAGMGMMRGGGGGIEYLLRDEFITDVAAGAMDATLATPGPGKRAASLGATSTHVIAGGKLVTTDGTNNDNLTWTKTDGSAFARAAGRIIRQQIKFTDTSNLLWDHLLGTYEAGFLVNGTTLYPASKGAGACLFYDLAGATMVAGQDYELSLVMGTTGSMIFIHDGIATRLLMVEEETNAATFSPVFANFSRDITSEYLRIYDLPSSLAGLLALSQADPTNDTSYSAAATHDLLPGSWLAYLTFTAPNPLAGSIEFKFWYVDANNYWSLRFGNTGSIFLKSVIGGTTTDYIKSSGGAVSAGETVTLAVYALNGRITVSTCKGTTWAYLAVMTKDCGAMVGAGRTTFQVSATSYTATSLKVWPIRSNSDFVGAGQVHRYNPDHWRQQDHTGKIPDCAENRTENSDRTELV